MDNFAGMVAGIMLSHHTLLRYNLYDNYTEWPKKIYTLFTHQYLWNKFKRNFYFRVRV